MSFLRVDGLSVCYPGSGTMTVNGLSFGLARGEIGCLLGASGCGKTTVLRVIAGFIGPQAGQVRLADRVLSAPGQVLPPEARQIGLVFQDFALFPHLTVAGNVGFGLQRLPREARVQRVEEMLRLTQLQAQAGRYPHELSGGQQQRVALARALAPQPSLLLLDEPFSSLDASLREQLGLEVRSILKETNTTAILVTHDQQEAFAVCDWIGVIREGRMEQWDSAHGLYHRPASAYVAGFVGEGSLLAGVVLAGEGAGLVRVQLPLGEAQVALMDPPGPGEQGAAAVAGGSALREGQGLRVLLRPDDVVHDVQSPLRATLLRKTFRGAGHLCTLALPSGEEVVALVPGACTHEPGASMGIRLQTRRLVGFPAA
ncbi:MAG: ABC transporter ATP-binding protein [Lautropia sp.]|nr:ABC transporter ATP-binding protein [Lautropia sp.]